MAKSKSIIKLSGTISGMTHVNSKAYGPHVRAAKGTHSEIVMSAGMRDSSVKQTNANLMAKIIFDEVNTLAPIFKNGIFWSRLVKVFRAQQREKLPLSYASFKGMEVRKDHPSSKFGTFYLDTRGESKVVFLRFQLYEQAGKKEFGFGYLDGDRASLETLRPKPTYQLTLLRIATDETLLLAYVSESRSHSLTTEHLQGTAGFDFPALPAGAQVLYVLKVEEVVVGERVKGSMGVVFLRVE